MCESPEAGESKLFRRISIRLEQSIRRDKGAGWYGNVGQRDQVGGVGVGVGCS